ncbi:MAG: hypothetical protein ACEY3D_06545 [Rickettsia sp.]|uniref:hypothetical protein n=1 Tax=Rickettsia sp. TaxID=789 RepID=UPI00397A6A46
MDTKSSLRVGIVAWIPEPSLRGAKRRGNPEKKYKYSKFLKLKARFMLASRLRGKALLHGYRVVIARRITQ